MTAATPRVIRAIIDQDALARVPSFFDAGLEDILNELFQNSRRAGATRVDITHHDGCITVADNGDGIENPQSILSFGRSEWGNPNVNDERPAGMGFYALARRDYITVWSKTRHSGAWQVTLEPEHFSGNADAEVLDIDEMNQVHGTSVSFKWENNPARHVYKSARYFPLEVTLNGEDIGRADFLEEASSVHEWEGLRIGVYQNVSSAFSCVNFYGVVVQAHEHLPHVRVLDHKNSAVRIDIVNCPHLELTLPARKKLIWTSFLERLNETCRRAIYTDIIQFDIDVPWQTQQDASKLGISIPDAQPMLKPWTPSTEWDHNFSDNKSQVLEDPLIINAIIAGIDRPLEYNIHRAIERNNLPIHIFHSDTDLVGYPWYNRLSIVIDLQVIATFGEHQYDIVSGEEKPPGYRPDSINMEIVIENSNGEEISIVMGSDVAMTDDEDVDVLGVDDANPYVTLDSDITVDDLVNLMMSAYFRPYEYGGGDSYETQEEESIGTARTIAVTLLQSQEEAFHQNLIEALRRVNVHYLPSGTTIQIAVSEDRSLVVEVSKPNTNQ